MKLYINDAEIDIPRKEMIIARNAVNSFLSVASKSATSAGNPVLYTITVLMMYAKSTEILNELGIENIQYIMEHFTKESGEH